VAFFIFHDIWFNDIAAEFASGGEDAVQGDHKIPMSILFLSEFFILGMITIEVIMHSIGYGLLYMMHLTMVFEAVFVILNCALSISMANSLTIKKNSYGIKMLFTVTLLYLRLDTLREKMKKQDLPKPKPTNPNVLRATNAISSI